MQRAVCFVLLSILWVVQAGSAQEPTRKAQDPNVPPAARDTPVAENMRRVVDHVMAQHPTGNLCAVVVLPGPAESFEIRLGVFNVAADRLDVLIMDSFRALGGQSLLHGSAFDTVAPAPGTLTVLYPPDEAGKGPMVLGFTEFTQFKSAAFNTDPDTYDDPDFGTNVLAMDQTLIELVYARGLRCQGTLVFDAAQNASFANIVQVFP